MRSLIVLVLLPLLAACSSGDDDAGPVTCHEVGCPSPFECIDESEVPPLGPRCSSESAGTPSCMGTPMDSQIPFLTTPSGTTVHVASLDSCIRVTYDGAVAQIAPLIADAVTQLNEVSCSELCFEDAGEDPGEPEPHLAEQRIHFNFGEASGNGPASSTVFFEQTTGRFIGCTVSVVEDSIADLSKGDVLGVIMLCVGFATGAVDSVTQTGVRPDALTAADEQALCTLYGSSPYCS